MLRSVDSDVADIMTQKYVDDPTKFEWLCFFNRNKAVNRNSLYDMVKNVDRCPYFVRRVKLPHATFPLSLAQYIMQVKETGLSVVQLMDTCSKCCHAVGINVEENVLMIVRKGMRCHYH